jgi:hypothetical protein
MIVTYFGGRKQSWGQTHFVIIVVLWNESLNLLGMGDQISGQRYLKLHSCTRIFDLERLVEAIYSSFDFIF